VSLSSPARPALERCLFIGGEDSHTVFEAEVIGAILALDIARASPRVTSITIFLDNQAAIRALTCPHPQLGQQFLETFHSELLSLRKLRKTLQVHIAWVPGHEGIEGNEATDECAKRAASSESMALH
jgi:ribonuclease HI